MEYGFEGLGDRGSAPHSHPNATSPQVSRRLIEAEASNPTFPRSWWPVRELSTEVAWPAPPEGILDGGTGPRPAGRLPFVIQKPHRRPFPTVVDFRDSGRRIGSEWTLLTVRIRISLPPLPTGHSAQDAAAHRVMPECSGSRSAAERSEPTRTAVQSVGLGGYHHTVHIEQS